MSAPGCWTTDKNVLRIFISSKDLFQLFSLVADVIANKTERGQHKSTSLQQVHEKPVIRQTTGRGETAIMP